MTTPDPAAQPRVAAALDRLRDHGERVTPGRRLVLEILNSTPGHLSADEIVSLVADRAPGVHRATVYRALARLGELHLVSHTHLGGSGSVYHLAEAGPDPATRTHAHLQCTTCGTVIDVAAETFAPLSAQLDRDLGFRFAPEHTALLGSCADCRASDRGHRSGDEAQDQVERR